ncbi:MAG: hypothetical protein RLZZ76_231 [Candidatus Parcubacteria bacterium]
MGLTRLIFYSKLVAIDHPLGWKQLNIREKKMPKKRTAPSESAYEVLKAFMDALTVSMSKREPECFTEPELYALNAAFEAAKPHMSSGEIRVFLSALLPRVDWDSWSSTQASGDIVDTVEYTIGIIAGDQ